MRGRYCTIGDEHCAAAEWIIFQSIIKSIIKTAKRAFKCVPKDAAGFLAAWSCPSLKDVREAHRTLKRCRLTHRTFDPCCIDARHRQEQRKARKSARVRGDRPNARSRQKRKTHAIVVSYRSKTFANETMYRS
jgi:hypothetical protein